MKPDNYAKLEKDYKFKKSYLNTTTWWKNGALMAPIILMFGGLVGILYLFNMDRLISISVIPYLLLFAVGTILFKAIRMNLQKKKMAESDAFHVCIAVPFGEEDGYTYTVFTNDSHRHNKHYVKNLAKGMDLDNILLDKEALKQRSVLVPGNEDTGGYYLRSYKTKEIYKRNQGWKDDEFFPVLYIDEKNTLIISRKDLVNPRK